MLAVNIDIQNRLCQTGNIEHIEFAQISDRKI